MILVIETATTACSVALIEGDRVIAYVHEDVARGHAERLVPRHQGEDVAGLAQRPQLGVR